MLSLAPHRHNLGHGDRELLVCTLKPFEQPLGPVYVSLLVSPSTEVPPRLRHPGAVRNSRLHPVMEQLIKWHSDRTHKLLKASSVGVRRLAST